MTATAPRQQSSNAVVLVSQTNVPALIAKHEMARRYIEPLLPKGVTLDEVAAKVRLALAKDVRGDLQKCTVGSLLLAVAKVCAQRLEIGVTAHLVPFGSECTMLRDYTGDIQLAIETGIVRRVAAHIVYANEPFVIRRRGRTEVEHLPIHDPNARGAMVGAYANVFMRGNDFECEYMTVEEVDAIRQQHSKQWKGGPVPRWYMKKTVIRQSLKLIPKTPRWRAFMEVLDDEGRIADAEHIDAVIASTPLPALAPGDVPTTPVVQNHAPRPLATPVDGAPYADAPEPPAQHSDDPSWNLDDAEEAELDLGEERKAPSRKNALREN